MKIIDAAVQPPVEDILKTGLYDGPGPASGRYRRDQALDPAYLLKSLDLFLKDQRSTGVVASIVSALAPVVTFDAYANLTGPMTEFPNEQVAAICDEPDGFYGGSPSRSTATTRSSTPSTKRAPPATSPPSSCTAASPAPTSPTPTPSTSNASP